MIHYHGTPISPVRKFNELAGENFCVSFWRPDDIKRAHALGQSVMLDNGAFSAWRKKVEIDWDEFYVFCEKWLVYPSTWAVIPDVIEGSEEENDDLIERWPFGDRGAPVWHLHESFDRLTRLIEEWPRVCLGSSAEYATVGSPSWHIRMADTMDVICDERGRPPVWLHMLRGMSLSSGPYPFASVDSTDVARNHNRPQNQDIAAMARRWNAQQPMPLWSRMIASLEVGVPLLSIYSDTIAP